MGNKKYPTIIIFIFFCLCLVENSKAETLDFACQFYGEEGLAADFWIVDASLPYVLHKAGSQFGKIEVYDLRYDIENINSKGVSFSKRALDRKALRMYKLNFLDDLVDLAEGDFSNIERSINRQLTFFERKELKKMARSLYNLEIFMFIDFKSLEFTFYFPEIKFELNFPNLPARLKNYKQVESFRKGNCDLI